MKAIDYSVVPRPIFTMPETACVGATGGQLKGKGMTYKTGRFGYAALGKALCDGRTDGFLQVYSADDGTVLGAQCLGEHATDICAEVSLAMRSSLKVGDVVRTIHAHPTYSEMVVEAMEDAEGRAVHKARGKVKSEE
jgi:dihydrolipoamide dehydrogenase